MYNTTKEYPGEALKTKRQTVAEEILDFASKLAEMSEKYATKTGAKLEPIMVQERPQATSENAKETIEYSPYFQELKHRLMSIESSLNRIDYFIERVTF